MEHLKFTDYVSAIALIVSLITFLFTWYRTSPIGAVSPLEPSGFAVIRGVETEQGIGPFPSDHLVLPMQWKNTSGRPTVVQRPELHLYKIHDGRKTSEKLVFTLAGEYPDISTGSFSERYIHKNSFSIAPHSVSLVTQIFHHKEFWNTGRTFTFNVGDEHEVVVKYRRNSGLGSLLQRVLPASFIDGERTEVLIKSLKQHGSLNHLKLRSDPSRGKDDPWWDYWEDLTY